MAEPLSKAPVATDYTLAFVIESLPAGARTILEVGCGEGELAARLMRDGFEVVAIDSDEAAIEAARAAGVDARAAQWPAPVDRKFDAVLFTRSLHHIGDLGGAVEAARDALRPGGRIIVEDFRAEGAGDASNAWFVSLTELLSRFELLEGGFGATEARARLGHDDHDLHSSTAIAAALKRMGVVEGSQSAYYFRYLEPHLAPDAARGVLAHELELIASRAIEPLGRRFTVEV